MLYDKFVNVIVSLDDRNIVKKINRNILPIGVPEIYRYYDFIDVEISCSMGTIRFYPFSELDNLRKDYSFIEADCIFATNNAEPILLKEKIVYTCIVGKNKVLYEKLASSFDDFIDKTMN